MKLFLFNDYHIEDQHDKLCFSGIQLFSFKYVNNNNIVNIEREKKNKLSIYLSYLQKSQEPRFGWAPYNNEKWVCPATGTVPLLVAGLYVSLFSKPNLLYHIPP